MGFTANTAFVVLAGCAGALLSALLLGASFLLFRRRHKRSRRALWEQAYVDPVTGGPTRLRFERDAEALASAAAPGSYAVVDINLYHFRFMNNLFGRAEGDRILRHIYTTCSARLQPGELICHIAADDFRFLLHFSGQGSMVSRVQEMAEAANEFNNELTDHYYLWFKAGVSVVDGTADTFAAYLDYAKIACKENGPGRRAGTGRIPGVSAAQGKLLYRPHCGGRSAHPLGGPRKRACDARRIHPRAGAQRFYYQA